MFLQLDEQVAEGRFGFEFRVLRGMAVSFFQSFMWQFLGTYYC